MGKRIAIAIALIILLIALGQGVFWLLFDKPSKEAKKTKETPALEAIPESVAPEQREPEQHIKILSVEGTVERQGQDTGWKALRQGEVLKSQESIRTDESSRAVLDVGETATVTVEPRSQFSVQEITRTATRVRIDDGRIGALVHGKGGSIYVESKGSDAIAETDRGEFSVLTTGEGQVSVATKKGRVRLSAKGKTVEVEAGEQSVVHLDLPPAEPEPIPTTLFLKVAAPKKLIQRERQTIISGATAPGAVISLNGTRIKSDVSGEFRATVPLEEGPNRIVVEAEDVSGHHEVARVPKITVKSRLSRVRSRAGKWGAKK